MARKQNTCNSTLIYIMYYDYISNLSTEVKERTLIFDGSNYQNRNQTLVSASVWLLKKKKMLLSSN